MIVEGIIENLKKIFLKKKMNKETPYRKQVLKAIEVYKEMELEAPNQEYKKKYRNEVTRLTNLYQYAIVKGW